MESPKNGIEQKPKPAIPLWGSIPLYLIANVVLMIPMGLFFLPLDLIENNSASFLLFKQIVSYFLTVVAVTITSVVFIKYIDNTSVKELGLSIRGRGKDILLGFIWAVVLYGIGFVISLWMGVIEIAGVEPDYTMLVLNFIFFFFVSWMEELMVRGYIQGRLMTRMNKFLALVLASLLFSAMHLANPNLAFLPLLNLFLAGVLLGSSFLYTKNLWFPITLHLFWNWIQGPVLGYQVSGTNAAHSLLTLSLPENNIWNGGGFGFEGSIICTVLMLISIAIIIGWGESALKKKQLKA